MKQGIMQFMATFMISLVIMLPVYISDVHAVATLSVDRFSGADNVTGYVRGDYDTFTIEVLATISEQIRDITKNQLAILVAGIPSPYLFDDCDEEPGAEGLFRCSFVRDGTFRGTQEYNISLFEEGTDNALKSIVQSLTADSYGAEIVEMSVEPQLTSTGQVTVTFDAEDYSVDRGDTSECSGFDRIEFYLGDLGGSIIQTILPSSGCTHSDSFTYTFPSSVSGDTQICGKAYDLLGQSKDAVCREVNVDRDAPSAGVDSLTVTVDGEDLLFVNPRATTPILAKVTAIIIAADLKEDSVTADFSAITDNAGFSNKPYSRYSVVDHDEHIYIWENIPIELVSSCLVTIKGEDIAENQMSQQLFCGVSPDVTGPSVLDIIPLYESDSGVPYISQTEGELAIEFREEGGGMDPKNVFLDLTNINGRSKVKAKNCEHEDGTNKWACFWENIAPLAADGEYSVSVRQDSADALGNEMTASYAFTLGIDTMPPVLDNDTVDFQSYHTDIDYGDVTVKGDVIEIIIPATGFDSAFADFSSVGGPTDVPPDACWTDENGTFCLFSYTVDISGPYTANIGFDFYDFSGHKVSTTFGFDVSGILNETSPDYWEVESITCSPETIDRSVTTLLAGGVKSFCRVALRAKGNVEITAIGLGDFSECTGDMPDYIYDINVMMNTPGTEEVYLMITLGSAKIDKDVLEFECPLYIMSKVTQPDGVYYTENLEVELVSRKLLFYDMPLGNPGQRIIDKTNAANDAYKIAGSWYDDFETYFYWYEKICSWEGIITDVTAAVKSVVSMLGWASMVWDYLGPGYATACEGVKYWENDIWIPIQKKFLNVACSLATCSYSKKLFEEVGVEFAKDFDVKKSLVWSILGLCIPGVLRGFGKWRQIECQRAICYTQQVASGMKVYECDASYSFQTCKFILGEIFNAIPFVQVFSNYMGMAESYISNPGELAGWILTQVLDIHDTCDKTTHCDAFDKPKKVAKLGCDILTLINTIGMVIGDIQGIKDESYWKTPNTICQQWEDLKDDARAQGTSII